MILQIALGIVLAVVILALLPLIIQIAGIALLAIPLFLLFFTAVIVVAYLWVQLPDYLTSMTFFEDVILFIPAISVIAYAIFGVTQVNKYCDRNQKGGIVWVSMYFAFVILPMLTVLFLIVLLTEM